VSITVTLKWETTLTYEREVEIDEDEFKDSGMDMESYVDDNLDEIVADLEEDYDDGKLTSQVDERRLVQVDGYEEGDDDD
jgi:hypothetical protein